MTFRHHLRRSTCRTVARGDERCGRLTATTYTPTPTSLLRLDVDTDREWFIYACLYALRNVCWDGTPALIAAGTLVILPVDLPHLYGFPTTVLGC